MNILYITGIDLDVKQFQGIYKKVIGQSNALRGDKNSVYTAFHKGNHLVFENEKQKESVLLSSNKFVFKIQKYNKIYEFVTRNKISVVYIRFDGIEPIVLNTLRKLKKLDVKVILELPTYPFMGEVKARMRRHFEQKKYLKFLMSVIYRGISIVSTKFAKKYVDRIVTFMDHDRIWGIEVISIDNGIEVNSIPFRSTFPLVNENYVLSCVANVSAWHGLDRVIEGLAQYKAENGHCPSLWIIGEGNQLKRLRELSEIKNVENEVVFWGNLTGDSLTEVINKSHVTIGSLGLYRIGLQTGSTLKTKEYCARGIPFIYGYNEKQLTGNEMYALKVPNNSSPINIADVIKFADKCVVNGEVSNIMRKEAHEKFDWNIQMKPVLSYLKGE